MSGRRQGGRRALRPGRRTGAALALAGLALTLGPPMLASAAAPGDLDRAFGGDGRVLTDFFERRDEANDVAIQRDGKVVVVGWSNRRERVGTRSLMTVARYDRHGHLDRSFGQRGRVVVQRWGGEPVGSEGKALALQSNGKVVVAGDGPGNILLARLRGDGSLDPQFGHRGKVQAGGGADRPRDLALQPDGKIVVAGYTRSAATGDAYVLLARFRRDGSVDRSFGEDGVVRTNWGHPADALAYGVAIQEDSRIVVSGEIGNNTIVARLLDDGSLDPTFDGDGIKFSAPKLIGPAYDVAIQPDGRIVVAACHLGGEGGFAVGRYLADGSFDESFGQGGTQYTRIPAPGRKAGECARALALERGGRIVLAGDSSSIPRRLGQRFALTRYTAAGALDLSFGRGGIVKTRFRRHLRRAGAHVFDQANAVAIRGGRIVAAGASGSAQPRRKNDWALARYLAVRKRG